MKKVLFEAMKVLNTNANITVPNIVAYDEPTIDLEARALFNSKDTYQKIFGPKKKDSSQAKQRLSVVRIAKEKRKIFRQYSGRAISFGKSIESSKCVGLSPNSWQQLCLDSCNDKEVVVSKSWWFPFFWNHSNSATRVSFRVGMMGLALAIVGIILPFVL